MAGRKLWETRWPELFPGEMPKRHESRVATYRWIENEVRNWLCGALAYSKVDVYVDERDGRGMRLFERLDLDELAKADRYAWESGGDPA